MIEDSDRDVSAGEYVLGLIEGADRTAFENRLAHDDALNAAVERWRTRLASIDAGASPVEPSSGLWQRIEGGLQADVAAVPQHRPLPARPGLLSRWWDDLWIWRGAALAGLACTALLGIALVLTSARAHRQPVMVAVLLTDANVAAAVVNTFADGRTELLPLQDIAVPQGRALQIWTLWDRQTGPRSVGLIDRAQTVPLRLDNLPLGTDQLFEITLEPAAGSPTGRPTGPIIAKGLTARSL